MEMASYYLWAVTVLIGIVVWERLQKWRFLERLPKGSYGFPLIGETFQFATQTCCGFARPRAQKYGAVFRTHILGEPTIFVTNADAVSHLTIDTEHEYQIGFSKPLRMLFGEGIKVGVSNDHEKLIRLIYQNLNHEAMAKALPEIDRLILSSLSSWTGKVITFKDAMQKLCLTAALIFMLGFEPDSEMIDEFLAAYSEFVNGLVALPINLPGFTFHKALKGRTTLHRLFDKALEKRQKLSQETKESSILVIDSFTKLKGSNGKQYTRTQIRDMLAAVCLAAAENTSVTAMYTIKLVHEHPEIFERLAVENQTIMKEKGDGEPLSYADIRKMKYASQVTLEAIRLENPVVQITRRSLKDAEYKGQFFPKDIVIIASLPMVHSDPVHFPNPEKFDPSRFEEKRPKEFVGFGAGRGLCPAQIFVLTITTLLLHHVTDTYRLERVGSDGGFVQYPFPHPKDGLRMRVLRR